MYMPWVTKKYTWVVKLNQLATGRFNTLKLMLSSSIGKIYVREVHINILCICSYEISSYEYVVTWQLDFFSFNSFNFLSEKVKVSLFQKW